MTKISILGCGWLGLPLAQCLLAEGYVVKASTTTTEKLSILQAADIQPFCLELVPEAVGVGWDLFLDTDILIVNIPPRLERAGVLFHPLQMSHLAELVRISPIKYVLYVSSTSVYPELNQEMEEDDVTMPKQSASPALVAAEQLIQALPIPSLILRCGGLMGYERIPGKYVSGKENLTTGDLPVNYVHRDDVVSAISHFLKNNGLWDGIFNVVAPQHPTRREVYETTSVPFGFVTPTFDQPIVSLPFKIISSAKLIAKSGFSFKFPNPLLFTYFQTKFKQ